MRIPIATVDTYPNACKIKVDLQEKFPDKTFQVRKYKNNFKVVERVWNPADPTEKLSPSKRRKKRRGIPF